MARNARGSSRPKKAGRKKAGKKAGKKAATRKASARKATSRKAPAKRAAGKRARKPARRPAAGRAAKGGTEHAPSQASRATETKAAAVRTEREVAQAIAQAVAILDEPVSPQVEIPPSAPEDSRQERLAEETLSVLQDREAERYDPTSLMDLGPGEDEAASGGHAPYSASFPDGADYSGGRRAPNVWVLVGIVAAVVAVAALMSFID